jgi:hypothetical protein
MSIAKSDIISPGGSVAGLLYLARSQISSKICNYAPLREYYREAVTELA